MLASCHPVELRHILLENDNIRLVLEAFMVRHVSFIAAFDEAASDYQTVAAKQAMPKT